MRRIPVAIVLGLLIVAALAVPVSAKNQPSGNRINLFAGDQSYPANTAFHVGHGFGQDYTATAFGKYEFTLTIDGVSQKADYKDIQQLDGPAKFAQLWEFNYPAGMTGTHDFIGDFYGPCGAGSGFDCAPGQQPNSVLLLLELEAVVTFTP